MINWMIRTTTKRAALAATALVLLLALAALPAAAQAPPPEDDEPGAGPGSPGGFGPGPGGPGGPDFEWWTSPRLKAQLGLSAEQEKVIQSIMFSSGEKMIDVRAAIDKARLEMVRVLSADAIDDAAAKKAIDRLVEAECQGARLRHVSRVDVAKVLTKDQRAELMQLMERRLRERPRGARLRAR
jgi:Spy/CpxP family protein refolding chaperone